MLYSFCYKKIIQINPLIDSGKNSSCMTGIGIAYKQQTSHH